MIEFTCPACGCTFTVPDDKAGRTGRCRCGEPVRIPAPKPAAALPPASSSLVRLFDRAKEAMTALWSVRRMHKRVHWAMLAAVGVVFVVIALALVPKSPLEQIKLIANRVATVQPHKDVHHEPSEVILLQNAKERTAYPYEQGYQWGVFYSTVADVNFDVRKTDSLASQYIAFIEFNETTIATHPLLKSQAESADSHSHVQFTWRKKSGLSTLIRKASGFARPLSAEILTTPALALRAPRYGSNLTKR